MVNSVSPHDKSIIEHAVAEANAATDAEFAVVIARAADEYPEIVLMCGIGIGAIAALLLWSLKPGIGFPLLLLLEISICMLMFAVPFLRHLCLHAVPKRLSYRRAAGRAMMEYVHLSHHVAAGIPIVLLYVSLAERYVHIFASREVRTKIADGEWHTVVKTLTGSIHKDGIAAAAAKAVAHGGEMLAAAFPATGRVHNLAHATQIAD